MYRAFWTDDKSILDSFFLPLFSDEVFNKYNKIIIYSVFGENPTEKEPDALYVHYSGEPFYKQCSLYDLYLVGDKTYSNIISLPLGSFNIRSPYMSGYFTRRRELLNKQKFCCNVVSMNKSNLRNDFFLRLNERKHVDSAGALLNNMNGYMAPRDHEGYKAFAQQYKFQLCFENSSVDYYLTEKLFNAYYHDTIPVYWGCPQVKEILNEKAFLCLPSNPTNHDIDVLIDQILELDQDEEKYKEMFYQPLFKGNSIPKELDLSLIRQNIDNFLLNS